LGRVVVDLRSGFAQQPGDDGHVAHLRTNNVSEDGRIDPTTIKLVAPSASQMKAHELRRNDILFNNTNSPALVGKTALFDEEGTYVFSNHMTRIRVCEKLADPRYVARYLHWTWANGGFRSLVTQWVNQAAINATQLEKVSLPLPPLSEQRRIVELLDAADGLRRKAAAARERAARILPALFVRTFGDPATNSKGWPSRPIVELASKFSDGPFGSNLKSSHYAEHGVRVVRLQNIGVGRFIDDDKAFIPRSHFLSLTKHRCLPGDVLVGTLGDPNLRACLLPPHIPEALNKADCVQIRVRPELASPEYVCWLLNMPSTLALASGLIHGQTRTRISMGRLKELVVPVPPLELQEQFAEQCAVVQDIEERQLKSGHQIVSLFRIMLHRAFSGQLTAGWRAAHAETLGAELAEQTWLLGQGQGRLWPEDETC
jgi:type I restriction enzyme S subunit